MERVYKESIFSGWLTIILGFATCVLFGVFIYLRQVGSVGTRPALDWGFADCSLASLDHYGKLRQTHHQDNCPRHLCRLWHH